MTHPDHVIDDLIWSTIRDKGTKGDHMCYIIHAPVGAKHLLEAKQYIKDHPKGNLYPEMYGQAIEKIRQLAQSDHPQAIFHMGKINAMGIGVMQNLTEAVFWYEKAIALGEPRAHANLGWFYQSGYGVQQDLKKAYELLSYGAKHNVLSAVTAIGVMMIKGEGQEADIEGGRQKIEEAYEKGYLNAGNVLSDFYFEGKYFEKNIDLSHEWLEKVANQGDERTMAILGYRLISGSHGKTDVQAGLAWMQKAIDLKYQPAWLWLGSLYRKGIGVEKDFNKALSLFKDGIDEGSTDCAKALNLLLAEKGLVLSPQSKEVS